MTHPASRYGGPPSLANDHLRLDFQRDGDTYTGYTVAVRREGAWSALGTGSFGRLVYNTSSGERRETPISLAPADPGGGGVRLSGQWTDEDGVAWDFEQRFELDQDPRQLLVRCRAVPDRTREVLHWSGPTFHAGEGAFGEAKTDALFPGLEYLLEAEPSSSEAFASAKYAARFVPHPYKVSAPMMAVSHDGLAVGLMWDPNQEYCRAWRHPSAVFASPNQLEDQRNHLLGLFAPGVPRYVEENELEAQRPIGAAPDSPLSLQARLVALTDAESIDVLKVWVDTYGLPALDPPHGYRENVDLCVRSYLDVAWDPQAQGWHHTLSDPWGPRYEPRVIAQLWRYGQWPEGDPALRARAREQVRRGLHRASGSRQEEGNPQNRVPVPHLELAIHYGLLVESLVLTGGQVRELLDGQGADGSWPWRRELIQHASYDTEQRRRVMGGREGDSSSGLTADRARTLLAWARMTGDETAREAGLRAVEWCNAQRRPEGAQTWELHLHVPDLLAVPYLVDINLEAYQLTGERERLAQAERWAWTGLPFTYLWRAYYRPIMAYGTLPVFGATFHDVQGWFGVDVHWNGLLYADALFRLAGHTGEPRWRKIAKGITACGMQQQQCEGPWLGMYPDAFSLVRGEEEYTWWLNPNLVGLNTFELAGLPLDLQTVKLDGGDGSVLRVTSGAEVLDAQTDRQKLSLILRNFPGEASQTLVAGAGRPGRVTCESRDLEETPDLDSVDGGWRWLAGTGVLVVKAPHASSSAVGVSVTRS